MTRDDLDTALAAMDRALRDRPEVVYDDLVEATRRLVDLRDKLIAARREEADATAAEQLRRINAILSVVVAAEYPLAGIRRERIEMARRELASLRI